MTRPWMPLYVSDYLGDTSHLSTAEHGAYFLLIMHYWQHGGLPADDRKLARITRMSPDDWDDAKDTLAEFFDDAWRHGRIDSELDKAAKITSKRKAAGAAGARARYGKSDSKDDGERIANATDVPSQTHSHPHPHPHPPSSVSDETGAAAPTDEEWLWSEGLEVLMGRGSTEKQARGLIGKWRKDGFTDAHIRRSIEEARDNGAAEPGAYVTKVLTKPPRRDKGEVAVRRQPTEAEYRTAVRKWREGKGWPQYLGPRPDMVSTQVPRHILLEESP